MTIPVTRSENGVPLRSVGGTTGETTIDGTALPHEVWLADGTASLNLTLPAKAKGKLLTVRVTIKFTGNVATRVATFSAR